MRSQVQVLAGPPHDGDRPVVRGHVTRVVVDTDGFLHDAAGGGAAR
jgi:hypothetical protein